MRRLVASTVAGLSIAVIYACGGVGTTATTDLGTDRPPSLWEPPGGGELAPNSGDPAGGCTCPTGKWKCGNFTFNVEQQGGNCPISCSGAFTVTIEGTALAGTFKGGELCVGGKCVSCTLGGDTDDGGATTDAGVKDTGKDTSSTVDVTKVCASICEIDSDCQTTCPVIPNAVACCDLNAGACTFLSGSTCQ
ncbi:hypothetical protein BH09MYX1_BH09MYX1_20810 [soil metagenome]